LLKVLTGFSTPPSWYYWPYVFNTVEARITKKTVATLLILLVVVMIGCEAVLILPAEDDSRATQPPADESWPAAADCVPTGTDRQAAQVVNIVDGDTIDVRFAGGQTYRVRLIGIDTPERGEFYYREASDMIEELLGGGTVTMVKDVSETDRFGRLLRYIQVEGSFVNYELVARGYAHAVTFPPDVACQETFREAERHARATSLGLWAPTPTPLPGPQTEMPETQAFTINSLTSPVKVGTFASLEIQTSPNATCSLQYTTPAGTHSQAGGLGETGAGESGVCFWRWRIDSRTTPGSGILHITTQGVTETVAIEIVP
jgi:endonuclease YncB( thermonuclease family)